MMPASRIPIANDKFPRAFRACVLMVGAALLLAANPVQAASSARVDKCNWDHPGVNPFMGDVVAAVDRYRDIPPLVRARLKERMADRNFDEFVTIARDSIKGQNYYEPRIRDMHFGAGTVCGSVSRAGWSAKTKQAGLVYCEGDHCILVPIRAAVQGRADYRHRPHARPRHQPARGASARAGTMDDDGIRTGCGAGRRAAAPL
ncbi:MHFG family PEP-CTERM protein, partial [Massilia sp. P8910]|uniref:MHFG family PEP-CTERM protein n=1 Tax=Massilia antarctica TaxID=2765360 RepID=UPI001E2ED979